MTDSVKSYLASLRDISTLYQGTNITLALDGLIAWLVLDLADRPVNVVNISLMPDMEAVLDAIDRLAKTGAAKAVIVASNKPRSFLVGADIDAMFPVIDQSVGEQGSQVLSKILCRIEDSPLPFIAAINGPCLGAGLELSLACSHRVASDSAKVSLGLPEVKLGLIPGSGGTVRLPRLIGLSESLSLILPGQSVKAVKALSLGLIDAVLPSEDRVSNEQRFYANVRQFASKVITNTRSHTKSPSHSRAHRSLSIKSQLLDHTSVGRYMTARMAAKTLDKQSKGLFPAPYFALDSAYNAVSNPDRQSALDLESAYFGALSVTPQSKALMSIFYLLEKAKKRPAALKGIEAKPIQRVAIIGAGVMGSQIAVLLALRKFIVYVRDINDTVIAKASQSIDDTLRQRVKKKKMSVADCDRVRASITLGTDLSPLSDCDLVIEAAVERMDLKKQILTECESVTPPAAIYATNTSALSLDELATESKRPSQLIGLHFFNPVNRMPLVEVIAQSRSSKLSLAAAYDFALAIGKVPVLVLKDAPGFIVNRLLGLFMNEAGNLAMEGFDIGLIDRTLERWGAPMGPFRLIDEVGLDIAAHVGPTLYQGLGDRYKPADDYVELLAANPKMLGKKSGSGFYVYSDDGKVEHRNPLILHQWHQLMRKKGVHKPSLSVANECALIVDRCVLPMINEAVAIIDEGLVERPEDVDLAMITGAGCGIHYGGLLGYADTRGLDEIVNRLKILQAETGNNGDRFKPHAKLVAMASSGQRFFPNRPDPKKLKPAQNVPRSKL